MDDVDAVQAQISRNMLDSGDWVTARLDGIAYLEKSPLKYWMIAISYWAFGVHDWVARLPLAISTGAGANSRIAIGTAVIGGMLTATALAIFYIPFFFVLVRRGVRDGLRIVRERIRQRREARA